MSRQRQRPDDVVRITFLGDTLIGGEAQPFIDEHGAAAAFDRIRHLFAGSDLVVANHEGPITHRDEAEQKLDTGRKRYWYRALPESTPALVDAGVRLVSLANNHVLDFGEEGLADTIRALDGSGIAHCGAGMSRKEARRPAIVHLNGLRVGFVSVMQRYDMYVAEGLYATATKPGPQRLNLARLRKDMAKLDAQVDVRVALVHWGRNYRKLNPRQQRLGAELRAAGADLVIGHHPHVPHRIRICDGVPVCYSLGNGPLGTPGRFHSGRPPFGLVISFDFDPLGVPRRMAVELIHVDNAEVGFQPRVAEGPEARRVLERLLPRGLEWRRSPCEGLVADLLEVAPSPSR